MMIVWMQDFIYVGDLVYYYGSCVIEGIFFWW